MLRDEPAVRRTRHRRQAAVLAFTLAMVAVSVGLLHSMGPTAQPNGLELGVYTIALGFFAVESSALHTRGSKTSRRSLAARSDLIIEANLLELTVASQHSFGRP